MDINELKPYFDGKRCAILGFGREGRIWLSLLQRLDCCAEIAVADMKPQDIPGVTGIYGEDYLDRPAPAKSGSNYQRQAHTSGKGKDTHPDGDSAAAAPMPYRGNNRHQGEVHDLLADISLPERLRL